MGSFAGSVGSHPKAIGTSAAHPMARPSSPSGVGSPKGTAGALVAGALMARRPSPETFAEVGLSDQGQVEAGLTAAFPLLKESRWYFGHWAAGSTFGESTSTAVRLPAVDAM